MMLIGGVVLIVIGTRVLFDHMKWLQ